MLPWFMSRSTISPPPVFVSLSALSSSAFSPFLLPCHPEPSEGSASPRRLPTCLSSLATLPLCPFPGTPLSRAVAWATNQAISLRFYIDAASSLSPFFATLTKNTPGGVHPAPQIFSSRHRTIRYSPLHPFFPPIMCPHPKESTQCTTAALAAPDGTSAKLVMACGDLPAGPAPTTPNRS